MSYHVLWIKNELKMFADDTKIRCKIMTEKDGATLQEDLDNLTIWSNTWQLKFNAEKCKVMHIGHSFKTEYYMTDGSSGKKKLESVQEGRDLGIIIRSDLKSSSHMASGINIYSVFWISKIIILDI